MPKGVNSQVEEGNKMKETPVGCYLRKGRRVTQAAEGRYDMLPNDKVVAKKEGSGGSI